MNAHKSLPWIVRERSLTIARFRYESDARRYVSRVAPSKNFTVEKDHVIDETPIEDTVWGRK